MVADSFLATSDRLRDTAVAGMATEGMAVPSSCDGCFLRLASFLRTDILPSFPDFCFVTLHTVVHCMGINS